MNVNEMIKMLEKDNTLEFNLEHPNGNKGVVALQQHKDYFRDTLVWIEGDCEGKIFPINEYTLKYNCYLIQKPVTFMEAINSGKLIKPEGWIGYLSVNSVMENLKCNPDSYIRDKINGNWYIKPEN